jgi:hypothetical protein
MNLLDRIVEGCACDPVTLGGQGDRDRGRHRPQFVDSRQQGCAQAGGVGKPGNGVRRRDDHGVRDTGRLRDDDAEAQTAE